MLGENISETVKVSVSIIFVRINEVVMINYKISHLINNRLLNSLC